MSCWTSVHGTIDIGVSTIPTGVINFLQCLASTSPVCAYIFPTARCMQLMERVCEVNVKEELEINREIQYQLPVVFALLKDLPEESKLPQEFKGVIIWLMDLANKPFLKATHVDIPVKDGDSDLSL